MINKGCNSVILYPPVLIMKWENHDINVASKLPKFSKLDDIVTSLRHHKLFFDDLVVETIVGYTNLYSHGEKAGISFEITNNKIRFFLSMLLLSGCHKLPDRKMYWETIPDTFV